MNLKNASRFPLRLTVDPMTAKASTVQIAADEQ
jgi:hypothetical protein